MYIFICIYHDSCARKCRGPKASSFPFLNSLELPFFGCFFLEVRDNTCPCQCQGGDTSPTTYFGTLPILFLSHSSIHAGLTAAWALSSFENPTSAHLIAQVVTITPPLPLLFHVRTFYIVRYTSSTSHPSQPAYTFNELEKGKRQKKQRRIKTKSKKKKK